MTFAQGHAKKGGRKKGARNKRTLAAEPKVYADALDYLSKVVAAIDDPLITPDMRLRAAIGLAAYQRPKPTPPRTETFVGPIGYAAPKTVEEARSAILALGERLAKCEISVEAHDALISGLRAYLGDKAVEQQRALDCLEDSLRSGAERP